MKTNLKTIVKSHYDFFLFILVISVMLYFITLVEPSRITEFLGVQNAYILVFVLAVIGGVSFVTATSFYAAIVTMALGGMNPILLALVAAPGILAGDLLFWYIGVRGRKFAENTLGERLKRFSLWLQAKPRRAVLIFIYFYTGFAPLPGDFLMVGLALTGYRFREIWLPTILGNFTLVFLYSYVAINLPDLLSIFKDWLF